LPAETNGKSAALTFPELCGVLVGDGRTPEDIAGALHPNNRKEMRKMRRYIEGLLADNLDTQMAVARKGRSILIAALPEASRALARRAAKGNPQAVKLLFEASGFHNPRIKHDHSGQVEIVVKGLPRPQDSLPEPVVDAEVVED
jgi:hypothetical protein